ncbi:hypothetical protein Cgig2_019968 [Carnegiea gigantea]|uniref:Uncharacterized protein n=1 Tax=Carnegiea gigantea TaxID=171969 RepID=A0A9Q1QAJ3_9CARY|nr:hypothetical protein Cgig2_019968 [Carnegiea gigantea]
MGFSRGKHPRSTFVQVIEGGHISVYNQFECQLHLSRGITNLQVSFLRNRLTPSVGTHGKMVDTQSKVLKQRDKGKRAAAEDHPVGHGASLAQSIGENSVGIEYEPTLGYTPPTSKLGADILKGVQTPCKVRGKDPDRDSGTPMHPCSLRTVSAKRGTEIVTAMVHRTLVDIRSSVDIITLECLKKLQYNEKDLEVVATPVVGTEPSLGGTPIQQKACIMDCNIVVQSRA